MKWLPPPTPSLVEGRMEETLEVLRPWWRFCGAAGGGGAGISALLLGVGGGGAFGMQIARLFFPRQ